MKLRPGWWQARADDVAVGLLTAMFAIFLIQIVSRYAFNNPLTWTQEMCLTTWLWTVFWGSAFCLKDEEHIRFDMLINVVSARTRRWFAAICALSVLLGFAVALPGTWDFVSFLTIKKSATLRIPLAYVFSIFLVFMVVTILTQVVRLRRILSSSPETAAS